MTQTFEEAFRIDPKKAIVALFSGRWNTVDPAARLIALTSQNVIDPLRVDLAMYSFLLYCRNEEARITREKGAGQFALRLRDAIRTLRGIHNFTGIRLLLEDRFDWMSYFTSIPQLPEYNVRHEYEMCILEYQSIKNVRNE